MIRWLIYKPFLKKFENKEDIIVMQVVATIATCLFKRLEASHKKTTNYTPWENQLDKFW